MTWEEEYDATKDKAISVSAPCALIIDVMKLQQLEADGFYYDSERKLAVFDTDLTQGMNCVVIRKDILDDFLKKTAMNFSFLV